jgi:hypothetical protein
MGLWCRLFKCTQLPPSIFVASGAGNRPKESGRKSQDETSVAFHQRHCCGDEELRLISNFCKRNGSCELLIWIDDRIGIEIVATSNGNINLSHCLVKSWGEADDLARRLTSLCPACGVPEFSLGGLVRGLPCEHQMLLEREREYAYARFCGYCNP